MADVLNDSLLCSLGSLSAQHSLACHCSVPRSALPAQMTGREVMRLYARLR